MRNTIFYILSILILISLLTPACVSNNEDAPPVIPFKAGETKTIAEIKALYDKELEKHYTLREPVEITENWSIRGIISADDKTSSGNLYKEAYVQDESAGLRMTFQSTGGLYVNDSVIVNCKGLYLSDYGDFIQLGSDPYVDDNGNNRVAGIDKRISLKRTFYENQLLLPAKVEISNIGEEHLAQLVMIENVEFADFELGKTYATPPHNGNPARSENRELVDCSGKMIKVRSSGYAAFAGDEIPTGNGTIVGIVTKFNTDYQLVIRHLKEVELDGKRCNE